MRIAALTSLLFLGAIFGFFYAWVCSTMWGLDAADPRVAIAAMQAMNASVRNAVFFPAFFLTPLVLLATAALAWQARRTSAALGFAAAGALYAVGGILFTSLMNIPLNDGLAAVTVPTDIEAARAIWEQYSGEWQWRNITRTVLSGVALLIAGVATLQLPKEPRHGIAGPLLPS